LRLTYFWRKARQYYTSHAHFWT